MSAMECMRRCQAVHDLRRCPVEVGSPQTKTQRDQVTRIINRLIAQSAPATIINKTGGSVKAVMTPSRSKLALAAHHSRNNSNGSLTSNCSAGSRTGSSSSSGNSTRMVKSSSKSQHSPSSSSTSLHASAQASPGKPLLPPPSYSPSAAVPATAVGQTLPSQPAVLSLPELLAINTASFPANNNQLSVLDSPDSCPMVFKKVRSDSVLEGNVAVGNLIGAEVLAPAAGEDMEMAVDRSSLSQPAQEIEVTIESAQGSQATALAAVEQQGNNNAVAMTEEIICIQFDAEEQGSQQLLDASQAALSKSNSSGSCEVKEFSGLHLAGDFAMEVSEK